MNSNTNHRKTWVLTGTFSLLVLTQPIPVFANRTGADGASLPFELYDGHIILAHLTMVGCSDPLSVMIDTGASHSVINRTASRRIEATPLGGSAVKAGAFDGASKVERVIVRGLHFAGRTLTIACYLADLPWENIDLLLGLDVLHLQDFRIDYQTRQMTFTPSAGLAQETTFEFQEGLILVDVQIEQRSYRLSVDTGAPFTSLHKDRCGASVKSLKGSLSAIRRLGGTSEVRMVTLPEMQIGDKRLRSVPALIVDGGKETESVRDGVIGPKSLGFRAVQFDFKRNRLSFED
jgi:predicted aspartyl protease